MSRRFGSARATGSAPSDHLVQRERVASSSIAAVGYDALTQTLEIEFHNGRIYQYFGIPPEMAEAMRAAKSTGAYFNKYVRNGRYEFSVVRDA